jgi:hypothetical protein
VHRFDGSDRITEMYRRLGYHPPVPTLITLRQIGLTANFSVCLSAPDKNQKKTIFLERERGRAGAHVPIFYGRTDKLLNAVTPPRNNKSRNKNHTTQLK